jgi:hypothetical protein
MRRGNLARAMVFAALVMMMVVGTASAAFAAGSITQLPNFSAGATWAVGSQKTITWTSAGLPLTDTLSLTFQKVDGTLINVVASGLPQNGSVTVTVPNDIGTGTDYVCYLMSSSDVYSDAANDMWPLTLTPPPVVSTPASSPWSIALAAFAALGLMAAIPSVRRRIASSEI